jgi:hypothetical protein
MSFCSRANESPPSAANAEDFRAHARSCSRIRARDLVRHKNRNENKSKIIHHRCVRLSVSPKKHVHPATAAVASSNDDAIRRPKTQSTSSYFNQARIHPDAGRVGSLAAREYRRALHRVPFRRFAAMVQRTTGRGMDDRGICDVARLHATAEAVAEDRAYRFARDRDSAIDRPVASGGDRSRQNRAAYAGGGLPGFAGRWRHANGVHLGGLRRLARCDVEIAGPDADAEDAVEERDRSRDRRHSAAI